MKITAITAVSALALMISVSAHAADDVRATGAANPAAQTQNNATDNTMTDVKQGLREAGRDIKAFFMGDNTSELTPVEIKYDLTAKSLIGKDIVNEAGNDIGTVRDIILDKNGKASMIVVSDGGLLGIGDKVAAFNYDQTVTTRPDGQVVLQLSQAMIDRAAEFSYDQDDWDESTVIPKESVSINELLDGDLLDNTGKKVADIENVYLRNAEASQVIVKFNQILGMGGDLAALNYDDLQMVGEVDDPDLKLSANQATQFRNFKKNTNE